MNFGGWYKSDELGVRNLFMSVDLEYWDDERMFNVHLWLVIQDGFSFSPLPFILLHHVFIMLSPRSLFHQLLLSSSDVSHATWILNRRSNFHVISAWLHCFILSLIDWAEQLIDPISTPCLESQLVGIWGIQI